MKHKRRILVLIILITLVICSTAFIFANSFMDNESSHGTSGAITDIITSTDDAEERNNVEFIIRKLAHVIEYAVLGLSVACLAIFIFHVYKQSAFGCGCFFVLFVAVIDEHIQSFSDRFSSTADILLDFFGSLIGFLGAVVLYFTVRYFIERKKKRIIK